MVTGEVLLLRAGEFDAPPPASSAWLERLGLKVAGAIDGESRWRSAWGVRYSGRTEPAGRMSVAN